MIAMDLVRRNSQKLFYLLARKMSRYRDDVKIVIPFLQEPGFYKWVKDPYYSRAPYLRKFGNPSIWDNFGCQVTVHTSAFLENQESNLATIATSLILGIHAIVDRQLSQQSIRWPVSSDHIASLGWELIEAACFFEVDRWLVTRFPTGLFLWGRRKEYSQCKILAEINPWPTLLTFHLTYSLRNRLFGKSLIYCANVISTT